MTIKRRQIVAAALAAAFGTGVSLAAAPRKVRR